MDYMSMTFVATGARRGKNFTYQSSPQDKAYVFVDGLLKARNSPQSLQFLAKYLAACVAAYPLGSSELEAADKRDVANGKLHVQKGTGGRNPEQVHPELFVEGRGTSASAPVPRDGTSGNAPGATGLVSDGNGFRAQPTVYDETRAGMIQAAVRKLDPMEDSHWTEAGKPAVSAVALALSDQTVTRSQIDASMPEYNRDKAALAMVT